MDGMIFDIQRFCLHDGFGIRTTVFFKGCNLRCVWCANPESQSAKSELLGGKVCGRRYTVDEVMAEVLKDRAFYEESGGGVTFSGGEPLLQADFVCALCDALAAQGVSAGIETAANVPLDVFSRVFDALDFAHIDLKHWDSQRHSEQVGAPLSGILANISYALKSKKPVIIRIPVIPGFNDSNDDAIAFGELLTTLGAKKVELLPFHQFGEKKYEQLGKVYAMKGARQLPEEELGEIKALLVKAGLEVQIGG